MTVTILLNVVLDADVLADEARRHGMPLDVAHKAFIADLEGSVSDVMRMRSGVLRVGTIATSTTATLSIT